MEPSLGAIVGGYLLLAAAVAAMAVGAAGLFGRRLRGVARASALLQAGYCLLAVAAGLLTANRDAYVAAVVQAIAGGLGAGLMGTAARRIAAEAGDDLPLGPAAAPAAWCVFCLGLACASLVGLPLTIGMPAKAAIIRAGLHEPTALFAATLGAAACGLVSLWAYAGVLLPIITGPRTMARPAVSAGRRVLVDTLIALVIGLGLAPYFVFLMAIKLLGGP